MKFIEIRRHSKRERPSPHLTQEGVNLARKIGQTMGSYFRIYSSKAPRAIETAVAMGFAIDEICEEISMTPKDIEKEVKWGMNFEQYANVINKGYKTATYVKELAAFLLKLGRNIPDSKSILLLSHGGLIELATIGCVPDMNYATWGNALKECEGVVLTIKDNKFIEAEKLLVD